MKKRTTGIIIAVLLVIIAGTGIVLYTTDNPVKDYAWLWLNIDVVESNGSPYLTIPYPENKDQTNLKVHNVIEQKIKQQKGKSDYSLDEPLLILNPYNTSTTGMYLYFKDDAVKAVEYTISTDGYADFTSNLNNSSTKNGDFEAQIIGLMENSTNQLTLTAYDSKDEVIGESTMEITLPKLGNDKPQTLEIVEQNNVEQLSNGLFTAFGFDRTNTSTHPLLMYDNNGVLRNELPQKVTNGDVIIKFVDNCMLYAYRNNQLIQVNSLGKIEKVYSFEGYSIHHDFDYDGEETIYLLMNNDNADTVEDLVISLDLETGEYHEVVDFKNVFPDIYERAVLPEDEEKLDWIHFNTCDYVGDGDMILSSRELSTIIYMENINDDPRVKYMIADEAFWKDTPYSDLLLTKEGDFVSQLGQHTTTYLADDSLPEWQYYIYCFNNNFAFSATWPTFDWSIFPNAGTLDSKKTNSYFYQYLIDENAHTFELVKSIKLPYSSIVSSTEYVYNDNIVTCSGRGNAIMEFDTDGNLLLQFDMNIENYTYRTEKFTYEGFWF